MPDEAKDIWFAVFLAEFIIIFIINGFTVIAFARSRHLRKRSTYLIMNLTVADLLVGAVGGPENLWFFKTGNRLGHVFRALKIISDIFYVASLVNLALISLERLHATLYPFKHCLVGKRVYYKIILCSWIGSLILASLFGILVMNKPVANRYAWVTYILVTLVLLTTGYVIIISKVLRKSYAQRFSTIILEERKLSITLFIVTAASVATLLPWVIATCISISLGHLWIQSSPHSRISNMIVLAFYYLNSILNPVIYAIRLPGYRRAVKQLFCKNTSSATRARPIELRAM